MRRHFTRALGILVLAGTISTSPLRAQSLGESPGPDLQLLTGKRETYPSPDKTLVIEQYQKRVGEYDLTYQFWVFDKDHKNPSLLNGNEDAELAGYPAGFRFSPNSQWLVRMQGTGAGFATLLLYKREGNHFIPATAKPLGALAWEYFFTQPISKGMPTAPDELNHQRADLLKGLEDNYAGLGMKWPDSRYIVITLSFDIQGNDRKTPWIEGWRCVYDTQTGQFSVPAASARNNAEARHLPKAKASRG
jgi:hypothetical protein